MKLFFGDHPSGSLENALFAAGEGTFHIQPAFCRASLGRARGLLRKFTQNRTTVAVNDCRGGFRPLDGSLNRFRERLAELCSYLTAKQTRIDCRRIGGLSDAEEKICVALHLNIRPRRFTALDSWTGMTNLVTPLR